eukprot:2607974-Pleurochrysis_carterae.AAC.1
MYCGLRETGCISRVTGRPWVAYHVCWTCCSCKGSQWDWSLPSADQQATGFGKSILGKALGEHIRDVVRSGKKGHGHDLVGNAVTNEVPATLDVLGLLEFCWVIRLQYDSSLVVHEQSCRLRLLKPRIG